jgi:hypothetical protein
MGLLGRVNVEAAYGAFLLGNLEEGSQRLLRVWAPYLGLPDNPATLLSDQEDTDPDPPEPPETAEGTTQDEETKEDSLLSTSMSWYEGGSNSAFSQEPSRGSI